MIFVLGLTGCVSQPRTLPAAHAVINRSQTFARNDYWRPTEEDIRALEADLSRLCARPDKRMSSPHKIKLSDTLIRYYGTVINGRRVIMGEAIERESPEAASWLEIVPEPDDPWIFERDSQGLQGAASFKVRFDAETKRVITLDFAAGA